MKKTMTMRVFCACLTVAGAVHLAAQQNPAGSASPQRSSEYDKEGAKIILQGCLERSASSAAAATSSFILTKAVRKGPMAGTTVPSSGGAASPPQAGQPATPGSAGAPGTNGTNSPGGNAQAYGQLAATYTLSDPSSQLAAHVGHQVEVSGLIEAVSAEAAKQGGTTTSPPLPGNQGQSGTRPGVPQTLKVEAVKMLAETCTRY